MKTKSNSPVHQFRHYCRSGNSVQLSLAIPRPGRSSPYKIQWRHPLRHGDVEEYASWRDYLVTSLSESAGRPIHLTDIPEPTLEPQAVA